MKNKKLISTLLYIFSAVLNICAIIGFASQMDNGISTVFLCAGSSLLCLASVFSRKTNENGEETNKKNEENSNTDEDKKSAE